MKPRVTSVFNLSVDMFDEEVNLSSLAADDAEAAPSVVPGEHADGRCTDDGRVWVDGGRGNARQHAAGARDDDAGDVPTTIPTATATEDAVHDCEREADGKRGQEAGVE